MKNFQTFLVNKQPAWLYGLNLIEEFKLYNLIRPVKNDLDLINARKCIKSLYSHSIVKKLHFIDI